MTPTSPSARWLVAALLCACLTGCTWFRVLTGDRRNHAQRLTEEARLAESEGELREAEDLLERAARFDPQDAELQRRLARLAWNREDPASAADHYLRVVELAPDDVEAWRQLGEARYRLGRFDSAHDAIRNALQHDPRNVAALLLEARLAEKTGDDDTIREACHRALRNDPENIEARLHLAKVYLNDGQPDRAAPLLRSIGENRETSSEHRSDAFWSLGLAYGMQNRWSDASHALEMALDLRPAAPTSDEWYRLAYARRQAGETEEADRALAQALDRETRDATDRNMVTASNVGIPHDGVVQASHTKWDAFGANGW